MSTSRARATVVAGAALIGVAAMPATAQGPYPEPTPCSGISFEDPAGDQGVVAPARKSPDNMDVIAGFVRYVNDAGGKPVLTTNIRVTKLDKTVDSGMVGASWYFLWANGEETQFTRVDVTSAGDVSYKFGHQTTDGLTVDGDTKGRFLEGQNGIVEVVVPPSMKATGKTLTTPRAEGRIRFGTDLVNNSRSVDTTANGKDVDTTAPCGGASSPTGPTPPGVPPVTTTPPSTTPPPSSNTNNNQAAVPEAQAKLNVRLGGKISLRRALKRKALRIPLQAGEAITGLQARLITGSGPSAKAFAAGKLAKASGKVTLKLRVSRKLKRGRYTLEMAGTNAAGKAGTAVLRVKVAR
jgi:hypothetical protein